MHPHNPAPPQSRGSGAKLTIILVLTVVSVLLAVSSTVIATLALSRSGTTPDVAAVPSTGASAETDVDPEPAPSEESEEAPSEATTSEEPVEPRGAYTVAFERQRLRVTSRGCRYSGSSTGIDVDEPRVAAATTRNDVGYAGCSPGSITTQLTMAVMPSATATPEECREQIRVQPVRAPVAAATGLTVCFLTSSSKASTFGITQKVVFLTVDALGEDNGYGILNLTLTAWNVP